MFCVFCIYDKREGNSPIQICIIMKMYLCMLIHIATCLCISSHVLSPSLQKVAKALFLLLWTNFFPSDFKIIDCFIRFTNHGTGFVPCLWEKVCVFYFALHDKIFYNILFILNDCLSTVNVHNLFVLSVHKMAFFSKFPKITCQTAVPANSNCNFLRSFLLCFYCI